MGIFRSFSEIVNSMIERLRLTQPNLDTKPGTVARDLFIDIQADQLERLHRSIQLVSEKQSIETATSSDLIKYASNFGIEKKSGAPSNGIVVFTTNQISGDIPIPAGTIVTSRSGLQYRTIGSYIMSSSEKSRFLATANRLRSSLNLAGISDSYAIEIPVVALNSGTVGNISSFQIIESNLEDALKVTNLTSFNGGTNTESDASFRAKFSTVFSGSNTGTAFGYRNAALSIEGVNDAIVIEPGSSLMLRDGTETIEVDDGSYRILNSGTGGKVDLYILGKQLEEVVESYVFTDKSGTGNISDERNDFILGQQNIDTTLTSQERRVRAFNDGVIPEQPADSVISVIGSQSGILSEAILDSDGNLTGNYILVKDTNPDTGGSPFGFDKIRFVSGEKEVAAESIIKQVSNSVDPLRFSNSTDIISVFQDISVTKENSSVSSADKTVINLNHSPVVSVSRVKNTTTGEVYVVKSQNIDDSGLNTSGKIVISGKTLPSKADILSVDYTWRVFYDKYIDYNGEYTGQQFLDASVSDSVDWGVSNGIYAEESEIQLTDDGLEYQVELENNISRVLSVYSATSTTGTIANVEDSDENIVSGIILSPLDEIISNIVSIKTDDGVEIYNIPNGDGSFSGRTIYLPSNASANISDTVSIIYNKVEFYNLNSSDGSYSNNIITLPSQGVLESESVYDVVNDIYLVGEVIYVDYVANIANISPSISLSSLPINGTDTSNSFLDSSLSIISNSNQPIFFNFDSQNNIIGVKRYGPTRLSVTASGTSRAGKLKVSGTTLTRLEVDVVYSTSVSGFKFDLESSLKSALNMTSIPSYIGIARVDSIISLDDQDKYFDLNGYELLNNIYAYSVANINSELKTTNFVIPSTQNNSSLSFTSGEVLRINLMVYNTNDSEDLYFADNSTIVTNKVFARVNRISVLSGFRTPGGSVIGSVVVKPFNQPGVGLSYYANYKFVAPTEGERITVRYNLNRLITDVTANLENVRCITADVLVKEAPSLNVDVSGQIIITEDLLSEKSTILENVSNAVINLLNTATLGAVIDYSDVINAATSVTGVDSANISLFNESGSLGRKTFIKALDNQYIAAGQVNFAAISRQDFKIT